MDRKYLTQIIPALFFLTILFSNPALMAEEKSQDKAVVEHEDGSVTLSAEVYQRLKNYFPPMPSEVRSVYGQIKTVNKDTLTVKADPSPNPFEPNPEKYTVAITKETKIIVNKPKEYSVYQKEMEAFNQKLAEQGKTEGAAPAAAALNYPQPMTEEAIDLKGLKEGDRVTVEAAENIKGLTEFDALRVVVQDMGIIAPPVMGTEAVPAAKADTEAEPPVTEKRENKGKRAGL